MLENLLNLVKEYSQDAIVTNSNVPNEKNEMATSVATDALMDGIKSQISQGNISNLMDIFSNKATSSNNSAMGGIQSVVVNALSTKVGLNPMVASGIASSIIPIIMDKIGKKAGDPNDNSFDFNDIFNSLGGLSNGIDANSMMNRLNDDNDGFGLDDVAQMLGGVLGSGQSQNSQSGGIIGSVLGGLFGGKK